MFYLFSHPELQDRLWCIRAGKCAAVLFRTVYQQEGEKREVLTNSINMILVELPKFENVSSECNTLLKKWLFLLRNMHELTQEEVENMFDDEILKEFIDKAAFEKLSDDEKIMYLKSCYDEGARRCHLRKEREEDNAKKAAPRF